VRTEATLRRAAARSGVTIHEVFTVQTEHGPILSSEWSCDDGWQAARFLRELSLEDADDPDVWALAEHIRKLAGSRDLRRTLHEYVLGNVRFAPEDVETFQNPLYTLLSGVGDCDDHANLIIAVAWALGLEAELVFLEEGGQPAHVFVCFYDGGMWTPAETTIAALYGEPPLLAAERLGVESRPDLSGLPVTADQKRLTIAGIGGQKQAVIVGDSHVEPGSPFAQALSQKLQAQGYSVTIAGVGATNAFQWATQSKVCRPDKSRCVDQNQVPHQPDLLVISLGTNDAANAAAGGRSVATVPPAIQQILSAYDPHRWIWVGPPATRDGAVPYYTNDGIAQLYAAARSAGVAIFDSRLPTAALVAAGSGDGVHLGPAGAQVWATAVGASLVLVPHDRYNLDDLKTLAASVGFPDPELAAAVAMAESGGDPRIVGDQAYGGSVGLWQINVPAHPEYDAGRLKEPTYNAQAAFALSKGGRDFNAWTVYRNGTYKKFYQKMGVLAWIGVGAGALGLSWLGYSTWKESA
jgi:lysophospholipase L1-like esterase